MKFVMKQKAEINIEEWLGNSVNTPGSTQTDNPANVQAPLVTDYPTATSVRPTGNAKPLVGVTTDVASSETTADVAAKGTEVAGTTVSVAEEGTESVEPISEGATWFWSLLEQAGFELW